MDLSSHNRLRSEISTSSNDTKILDPNATQHPSVLTAPESLAGADRGAAVGEVFGEYRIIKPIKEEGSFGRIDVAEDMSLGRIVALKRLKRLAPGTDGGLSDEARAIAQVVHPNVVKINKYGKVGDVPYFDMEYLKGGSLQELLQKQLPDWKAAARYTKGMADGVQRIHEEKMVHRDLKPANVLIDKDQSTPKVADFGLARVVSSASHDVSGTPAFMPPEQFAGQTTYQSDIWGIGATLYALLTGRPPFTGSEREIKQSARFAEPIAPRTVNRGIPRDLETICLKCLRKVPSQRYESAHALADDLDNLLAGRPIVARPTPFWERTWKWVRREPVKAALLVSAVLVLLAFGSFGLILAALQNARNELLASEIENREKEARFESQINESIDKASEAFSSDKIQTALTEVKKAETSFTDLAVQLNPKQSISRYSEAVVALAGNPRLSPLSSRIDRIQGPIQKRLQTDQSRQDIANYANAFLSAYAQLRFLQMPLALGGVSGPDSVARIKERERALESALGILSKAVAVDDPESQDSRRLLYEHSLLSDPTMRSRLRDPIRQVLLESQQRPPPQEHEVKPLITLLPPDRRGFVDGFQSGVQKLEEDGDLKGARDTFQRVLSGSPGHYWCQFALAVCYLRLEQPNQAEAHFSACESQDQTIPWLYLLRGLAKAKQAGRSAEAEQDFQKAEQLISSQQLVQLRTEQPVVDYVLRCGRSYALILECSSVSEDRELDAKLTTAIRLLGEATAEQPDEVLAHFLLSVAYLSQLNRVKDKNSDQIAICLPKAHESIENAIARLPNETAAKTVNATTADTATRMKLRRMRADMYFSALEYSSSLEVLKDRLAELTAEKRLRQTLEDLEFLTDTTQGTSRAQAYFELAQIHSAPGSATRQNSSAYDVEQAINYLKRAIDADPQHVPSRFLRSRLLLERATTSRPYAYKISSLKKSETRQRVELKEAERAQASKPSVGQSSVDRAHQDLKKTTDILATLTQLLKQSNEQLIQVKQDASQVIELASGVDREAYLASAYKIRGEAAETLGEVTSAYSDFGEILKLQPILKDRTRHLDALTKHAWLALNRSIEQWEGAQGDFQQAAKLIEQVRPSSRQTALEGWLIQTGLACAVLRLGNADNALQVIDKLGAMLDQQSPKDAVELETWRRIQHARADIYVQASVLPSQKARVDGLRERAVSALRKAITGSAAPKGAATANNYDALEYLDRYVEPDSDLQPIRETIRYQMLIKEF